MCYYLTTMANTRRDRVFLEIRVPKSTEEGASHFEQILASLARMGPQTLGEKLLFRRPSFSLEIYTVAARVHFILSAPAYLSSYLESQLSAQYPKINIQSVRDFCGIFGNGHRAAGKMRLTFSSYYPLRTYADLRDQDTMSSLLGMLAKTPENEAVLVQIVLRPSGDGWRDAGRRTISAGIADSATGRTKSHPHARIIEKKISKLGFASEVRVFVRAQTDLSARERLFAIAGAFGVFDLGEGNSLSLKRYRGPFMGMLFNLLQERRLPLLTSWQYLNIEEIASLFHPPNALVSGIRNLAWGKTFLGEPPENLPVAAELTDEIKKEINFFDKTELKHKQMTYGDKRNARRRHMYIVGKTGSGKSTLIANMAINDMRNREGLAVIDPHGDLSEIMLDYIPSYRLNDIVYLDPSDVEHPFWFNPLEAAVKPETKELVASGIVSIFYKIYGHSWGPRLEYILRNTILTLLDHPGTTLVDVAPLLTNDAFREKILGSLKDDVLRRFWVDEFANMHPRLKSEAIAPILNKIGQFVTSPVIRHIIGRPTSTVNLQDIMNEGKILILNLSQGKLGEDNAALLGAMFITKMQLAAMSRVYQKEEERKDFYLYVDEFQNFATTSFIKILSEARKYRLNLVLANQYIAQIDEGVQKAIFGNVGSLMSFPIGAQDAHHLVREFAGIYKEEELVSLSNYQAILKLAIDNVTSMPFFATTLPLPKSKNQNREKAVKNSQQRYTKKE